MRTGWRFTWVGHGHGKVLRTKNNQGRRTLYFYWCSHGEDERGRRGRRDEGPPKTIARGGYRRVAGAVCDSPVKR